MYFMDGCGLLGLKTRKASGYTQASQKQILFQTAGVLAIFQA